MAGKERDFVINPEDFPYICRTCLKRGELLSVFESHVVIDGKRIQVEELLKDCAQVEVMESDDLPQKICADCLTILIQIYVFCRQCYHNELKLKLVQNTPNALENDERKSFSDFEARYNSEDGVRVESEIDFKENNAITANLLETGNSANKLETDPRHCYDSDSTEKLNETADFKGSSEESSLEANQDGQDKNSKTSELRSLTKVPKKESRLSRRSREPYKCNICQTIYSEHTELHTHTCEGYQESLVAVPCSAKTRNKNKKEFHNCIYCMRRFTDYSSLRIHVLVHAGEKPYKCETCEKAFDESFKLQRHKLVHEMSDVTSYPSLAQYFCSPCGRSFKKSVAYKWHMKYHDPGFHITSPKDLYICETCGTCCTDRPALRKHRKVHDEKSFLCNYCGKSFRRGSYLDIHMRSHTGERPYKCTICQESFSRRSTCTTHMLTHTGIKPHTCKVCNKAFIQQCQWRTHLRVHSGEKPYVCNDCGKAFALKSTLTTHAQRHAKKVSYLCKVCGKSYRREAIRDKHEMIKHRININVEMNEKVEESNENSGNEF